MNQLIRVERGNTAAQRAMQIPTTVTMMKRGLNARLVSVKRDRPR
jgi:hypothetical protein